MPAARPRPSPPSRRAGARPAREGFGLRWQGDRCVTIDVGGEVGERAAQRCQALARLIRAAVLPGVSDVVPSFTAVTVHLRPRLDAPSPVAAMLQALLDGLGPGWDLERDPAAGPRAVPAPPAAPRVRELPVCYGGRHGPDLLEVAATLGLTPEEVVALHSGTPCTVLMIGFAPGHPYLGLIDARLALPRRSVPRVRVEPGSVAIANRQSVVYPAALPGGWHLIGRTPQPLFDPGAENPAWLAPGDRVRFVPIDEDTFEALAAKPGRSEA